jgi:ketosteroid isomerase-like protein
MNEAEAELWNLVRESNRAWMSGSLHEVADFFDERAVLIAPDLASRIEGRDAVVATYAEYNAHAKTQSFEELEHQIALFGDTAVVTYRFRIRYEMLEDGARHDDVAEEILVLRRTDRWRALFRTQTEAQES